MIKISTHIILIALGVTIYGFSAADGLKCVVCAPCVGPLPSATECSKTHCTTMTESNTGVKTRGCDSPEGGKAEKSCKGTFCTEYCQGDGCNSAVPTAFNPIVLVATISLFVAKNYVF